MPANQVAAHLQSDRGNGEHAADPQPARHISEFGIGWRIEARDLRLQRHAADRAGAGTDLADLRMHRAGVDRALRYGGFGLAVVEFGVMPLMPVTGVIVGSTAAPGTLCSADCVGGFSLGHHVLRRTACNPYPVGVYRTDAKRHQDILPKTPGPDRRPGPRP